MKELRERIVHYFITLFQFPLLKALGAETAVISNALLHLKSTLLLVLSLGILDLITGIGVSIRYHRVSSWGLRQTVLKLSIYFLLIFMGEAIRRVANIDWADSAFLGLIVMTETISILENIHLTFPGILPAPILKHFGIAEKRKRNKRRR